MKKTKNEKRNERRSKVEVGLKYIKIKRGEENR
jgi:hypothetical protein